MCRLHMLWLGLAEAPGSREPITMVYAWQARTRPLCAIQQAQGEGRCLGAALLTHAAHGRAGLATPRCPEEEQRPSCRRGIG